MTDIFGNLVLLCLVPLSMSWLLTILKNIIHHYKQELLLYLASKVANAFAKHQFRWFGSLANRKTRACVCILMTILGQQVVTASYTYQCLYLFTGHENPATGHSYHVGRTFYAVGKKMKMQHFMCMEKRLHYINSVFPWLHKRPTLAC